MNLIIVKRKLTEPEIVLFLNLIKETPNIIGHTKKEWRNYEDVWVAELDGKAIGVCVDEDFSDKWSETAVLYVLEEFRNKGVGKALYKSGLDHIIKKENNIYYVSRNPIVIKWMKEECLKTSENIFTLPLPVLLHSLGKSLNFFRIKEYIRKSFIFRHQPMFLHGYKIEKPIK